MLVGVRIHVEYPSKEGIAKVKSTAEKTGDIDRLSPTDLEVLALAVDLRATLITDDYSIQNTANTLGLNCIPMETRGIKKIYYWKYVCRGCGKEYERRLKDCSICGNELIAKKYKTAELVGQKR